MEYVQELFEKLCGKRKRKKISVIIMDRSQTRLPSGTKGTAFQQRTMQREQTKQHVTQSSFCVVIFHDLQFLLLAGTKKERKKKRKRKRKEKEKEKCLSSSRFCGGFCFGGRGAAGGGGIAGMR